MLNISCGFVSIEMDDLFKKKIKPWHEAHP